MTLQEIVAKLPEDTMQIQTSIDQTIQEISTITKNVENILNQKRDFYNTPAEINRAWFLYQTHKNIMHAIAYLHEDADMRAYALKEYEKFTTKAEQSIFNKGVYNGLFYYKNMIKDAHKKHQGVDAAVVHMMQIYQNLGIHLNPENNVNFHDIRSQLQQMQHLFIGNIYHDQRSLVATPSQLEGVPAHITMQLSKDAQGNMILPIDINIYCDIMATLKDEELRKNYSALVFTRAYPQNQDVLQRIFELSYKQAELMGYDSYSSFMMQQNFLQTSVRVHGFLQKTYKTLHPLIQEKMQQLKAYTPTTHLFDAKGNLPFWNEAFVKNAYRQHYFKLDETQVRDYFVLPHVLEGMFDVFGQLFALSFEKVDHEYALWAPEISIYKVRRTDNNNNLGYLFFDLYQREGKQGSACYLPLIVPVVDDCEIPCLGAGILNLHFAKSADNLTCLHLDEVSQLFHEFGHALQGLLGIYELSLGMGVGMSQDLQELPGYVTEFLLYEPEVLKRITHHCNSGEQMPQEMIEKISAWHNWQHFFILEKQLFLSMFSFEAFGPWHQGFDVYDLYHKLHKKYRAHIVIESDYHPYLSFDHIVSYGPLYYTYVLAHVYAQNIVEALRVKGLLDPIVGKTLEKALFVPLSAKDCEKRLHTFIGKKLL